MPQAQDDSLANYAPMIKKEDGLLDFSLPAQSLAHSVRAFNPWPRTFMPWQGQALKVLSAHAAQVSTRQPGRRLIHNSLPAVETTNGLLIINTVQPAGKKPMPGQDFLHGARQWAGE